MSYVGTSVSLASSTDVFFRRKQPVDSLHYIRTGVVNNRERTIVLMICTTAVCAGSAVFGRSFTLENPASAKVKIEL